jgi:thioredoxin reductase
MLRTNIAVIGAGPYGLSLGAHLRTRGADHIVIGRPMESWRSFMPKGMILKSERMASNLWAPRGKYTLAKFRESKGQPYKPTGEPLPLTEFIDYAEWFRERATGAILDTHVRSLSRVAAGEFILELEEGERISARKVVLASGHMAFRNIPQPLRHLPSSLLSHSSDAADVAGFRGRDVTVVGLGAAALEHAALLHEAGARVRVIGRRLAVNWNGLPRTNPSLLDRIFAPEAGLGAGWRGFILSEFPHLFHLLPDARRLRMVKSGWGPAGAWWLRQRVDGQFPMLLGTQIEAARPAGERLALRLGGANPGEIITDHVVAGTGYMVDFDRLSYVNAQLRARVERIAGSPRLSSSFETSVPGLFAVGIMGAATFGPVMRFMCGAKHAAPIVARALMRDDVRGFAPRLSVRQTSGSLGTAPWIGPAPHRVAPRRTFRVVQ